MKVVTIIPARGGSKGIPQKNIIDVNGQPLIHYSINASLRSEVNETFVCTNDSKIRTVSIEQGAKVEMRPDNLCDDIIMPDPTLVYFAEKQEFDVLVFLQPTSPLIKPEYINAGIAQMKTGKFDSVFTVTEEHWLPRWDENVKPIDWDIKDRPRRQDRSKLFIENGMMYITTREQLLESGLRYGGRIGFVHVPLTDSFQIDTLEDLELMRKLL